MKTDLTDLTFLFPLRPDSIIRVENLLATTGYILRNFNTKVCVLEVSAYNNGLLSKLLNRRIAYSFIEDKDPVFHRTKYRNLMTKEVKTPFLSVWDVDVIVDKQLIMDTMEILRNGKADVAFPYNGMFYDTSEIIRNLFIRKNQIQLLHKNRDRMLLIYGNDHKGGAFIASTEKYRQTGMENENFYGWGEEDFERYKRWLILGLNIYHASGYMYHLSHPRDRNGGYNSQRQMEISKSEYVKIWKSSCEDLILKSKQL